MKAIRWLMIAILCVFIGEARADTLALYTFTGNVLTPAATDAFIDASALQISSGSINFGTAQATSWTGSGIPYADSSTSAGSWAAPDIDTARYFYLTLSEASGATFSITNISFLRRATAAGPGTLGVTIDGSLVYSDDLPHDSTDMISIPVSGFDDLETAEIRILGWTNTIRSLSGAGALRLDDILIEGTVDAPAGNFPPQIGNPSATNITINSADVSAEITFTGGADITERGIVYHTTSGFDPVNEGTSVFEDEGPYGLGVFSLPVTGLTPSTTYYFVGYAINSEGTAYTTESSFMTLMDIPEGSVVIDFEGAGETKTGYASGTVNLSGLDWNLTEALIGTSASDYRNGARSARLRGYGVSAMTMLEDLTNGLGSVSFSYSQFGSDNTQVSWIVQYSVTAGASWITVGDPFTADATVQTFSEDVDVGGNVRIRFVREVNDSGTSDRRINIDDIVLTPTSAAAPGDLPPSISLDPPGASKTVFVDDSITFDVIADQVPEDAGQETELSALSLPMGATFAGATGSAPVQATFDWTPSVVGVYTAIFTAADTDGVSTQEVVISVQGPSPAPVGTIVTYDFEVDVNYPAEIADNLGWTTFRVSEDQTLSYAAGSPGRAVSATGWNEEDRYWFFELIVDPGYELNITSVSFDERASGTGPQAWGLRSSLDGFVDDIASGMVLTNSAFDPQSAVLDIEGATGTIEFRLYGRDAAGGSGTWRIDNFILEGTVEEDGDGPPPVDPDPVEISSFEPTGPGIIGATFMTEDGVTYNLEFTTDLTADPIVWIFVDTVPGDGESATLVDDDPASPLRIYRIVAE